MHTHLVTPRVDLEARLDEGAAEVVGRLAEQARLLARLAGLACLELVQAVAFTVKVVLQPVSNAASLHARRTAHLHLRLD